MYLNSYLRSERKKNQFAVVINVQSQLDFISNKFNDSVILHLT